jgi:DNA-binding MarR family transcriptional regulator
LDKFSNISESGYRRRETDVCFALLMTYAKDLVSGRSSSTSTATRERSPDSAEQVRDLRVGVMRLARRLRLERDDSDLTFTQLAALATLERLGDTTIGELAAAENVKPPSMTRTINTLVDMELVTRRPHESDGRQVIVGLTAAAVQVLTRDRNRRTAWLASHVIDELDDAERDVLFAAAPLLDRLAQS